MVREWSAHRIVSSKLNHVLQSKADVACTCGNPARWTDLVFVQYCVIAKMYEREGNMAFYVRARRLEFPSK